MQAEYMVSAWSLQGEVSALGLDAQPASAELLLGTMHQMYLVNGRFLKVCDKKYWAEE